MAKRSRGSTSRPGQRPPLQRQAARPATRPTAAAAAPVAVPRPETLTDAEEARAAELEASILAEEKAAEAARKRSTPSRSADAAPVRAGSSLEGAAAQEYAYVARDVRRIAMVGGSMILILLGIWLVVHLTGFTSSSPTAGNRPAPMRSWRRRTPAPSNTTCFSTTIRPNA